VDDASPPPEQAETETGFGTGLRAQLARTQEERLLEGATPAEEPEPDAPAEAGGGDLSEALSESLARTEELRRSLSARHAKLAEWVESQGRQLKTPEAASLLASGAAEAQLDRERDERADRERQKAELARREDEVRAQEERVAARAAEVERQAAEAARRLEVAHARGSEIDARTAALDRRETELETRERATADALAAVEAREAEAVRTAAEEGIGADDRARQLEELNERASALERLAAELEEREQRLERREGALSELKDWLVRKERELAAYLGEPAA
jgi:colicin import membrane protein